MRLQAQLKTREPTCDTFPKERNRNLQCACNPFNRRWSQRYWVGLCLLVDSIRHTTSIQTSLQIMTSCNSGAAMKTWLLLFLVGTTLLSGTVRAEESLAQALINYYGEDREAWREFIVEYADAHSESDSAWYYLGRVYFEEAEYKKSSGAFEQAIEITEGSSLFHLWLGRAYGLRASTGGFLAKARYGTKFKGQIDRALEIDHDNLDAREDRLQFYLQAPGIAGGSIEKAYAEAESIAVRDPRRGMNAKITILQSDDKSAEAIDEIKRWISEQPDDSLAVLDLVYMYQGMETWDDVFSVLDGLLLERPSFTGALYQVGRTAVFSEQRVPEGINALKRYIELGPASEREPQLSYAWSRLGQLYEIQDDSESAILAFQKAVELNPANEQATDALAKLGADQ